MVDALSLSEIVAMIGNLRQDVDDAERIERIALLEQIKSAAGAAQARETAAFAASQQEEQVARGVPYERSRQGIAGQIGLARRCSPFNASRAVGWSKILVDELPATFASLAAGRTTEWRAMLVARETAWLSREHRTLVDAEVGPRLEQWGDRRVESETRKIAYRLDPHGAVERANRAAGDRRVTIRPKPETMAALSVLAPVAQSVAAYASLRRHADTLIGCGDGRTRGQIMADTAIERLTGQTAANAVPVEINLIMTDQALLGGRAGNPDARLSAGSLASPGVDEPAHLIGYGPIPAPMARDLVLGADPTVPMWLRRLYRRPGTGELMTIDSRRRQFTAAMRRFLLLRDQTCRTPWCDAPIRHADHVQRHRDGGATTVPNGQGYCAACNYAKEAPGWSTIAVAGCAVIIRTPTGATYSSRPPDPPGSGSGAAPPIARSAILHVDLSHFHNAA